MLVIFLFSVGDFFCFKGELQFCFFVVIFFYESGEDFKLCYVFFVVEIKLFCELFKVIDSVVELVV